MPKTEHFEHYKKRGIVEPKNLTKPYLLKYVEKVNNKEINKRKQENNSEKTVRKSKINGAKSKIKYDINSINDHASNKRK